MELMFAPEEVQADRELVVLAAPWAKSEKGGAQLFQVLPTCTPRVRNVNDHGSWSEHEK